MKRGWFSKEQIIWILKEQEASMSRVEICELAAERRRFGYWRLGYLLAREGLTPNQKKLLCIYREEGMRMCRRNSRKRAQGTRASMMIPQRPNLHWSLDFVS